MIDLNSSLFQDGRLWKELHLRGVDNSTNWNNTEAEIQEALRAARADLNAIIHPLVRRRRAELIAQAAAGRIVVSVIPLLVETGLVDQFDAVVVVDVPSQTQVARLVRRNDISPEQAQARLDAQASRAERLAAADWVVTNSGSRAELEAQVERLWSQMRSKAQGCEPGK